MLSLYLKRFFTSFKQDGMTAFCQKIRNEFIQTRFWPTKLIRSLLVNSLYKLKRTPNTTKQLLFVYDTRVSPVSFDIISYLCGAEIERRAQDCESIFVLIIINPAYESTNDLQVIPDQSVDSLYWRSFNCILPALGLLPNISGHMVTSDLNMAEKFLNHNSAITLPKNYHVRLARQPSNQTVRLTGKAGHTVWPLLKNHEKTLLQVNHDLSTFRRGRKLLVISLTSGRPEQGRSSRTKAWLQFANSLDQEKWAVVFVQNLGTFSEENDIDFGYHKEYVPARWNLQLRSALYEVANLNMSVGHGPMELCWYNQNINYVIFMNPNSSATITDEVRVMAGFDIGQNLPFAEKYQKLVWQNDELTNINEEFRQVSEYI